MTKEIILNTKRELAEHYLNRDFSQFDYSLMAEMQKAEIGFISVQNPSEKYHFNDYKSNLDDDSIDSLESLKKNKELYKEFEEYVEQEESSNYPMWNTIWKIGNCEDYFIENVDKLADIGIGLLEFKDEYYLFIAGAGYNFYDAHWIPLFTKFFKWIDEDCGEKFKTIEIQNKKHAVFTGSVYLRKFIEDIGSQTEDNSFLLSDIAERENPIDSKVKAEWDILIKEMQDNDFEHLAIE